MTTINGHTLFPHNGWAAGKPVRWSRRWHTGVSTGIKGGEARSALRAVPLHRLGCTFVADSLPERARLEARTDQALKSGLAALPFFGRGMTLSVNAAAGSHVLTLAAANIWTWAAGDVAILFSDDLTFDAIAVQSIGGGGLALTLTGNLVNAWPAGSFVWPLIFGKFTAQAESVLTDWLASWQVQIEQLAGERSVQIGSVTPPAGDGVGVDQVGIDNDIA